LALDRVVLHDQIDGSPDDGLEPALDPEELEEAHGPVELDQKVHIAVCTRVAARDGAEEIERTDPSPSSSARCSASRRWTSSRLMTRIIGQRVQGGQLRVAGVLPAGFDELSQIVMSDADRVQDANVRQLAAIEQPVNGCGAHSKLSRDLSHGQEESRGPRASW